MDTGTERIVNRTAARRAWPAWSRPVLLFSPHYALFAAWMWAVQSPGTGWLWEAWAAMAVAVPLVAWGASIAAIDLSSERIRVRSHVRSRAAAMTDVFRVDARRSPWKVLATRQPAPYTIDLWLTNHRHWRLEHVEPEAGDRLLARLHGYHRPVWILPPL